MAESKAFKEYYDRGLAKRLGQQIKAVHPSFEEKKFVAHVAKQLAPLEFKQRIEVFSEALHRFLPVEFSKAWAVLEGVLGPELTSDEGCFDQGYALWPVANFIEHYGLEDVDTALVAMYEVTKRHTSEFAIRPYLDRYPDKMMRALKKWTRDPNPHVRRLVSEGTRPRLPWASRFKTFRGDGEDVVALLEKLKDDRSQYVRRSVANHLNDMSKDDPEQVIALCRRWKQGAPERRVWVIRHALRGLTKAGDQRALTLIGCEPPKVELSDFKIKPTKIALGESLDLKIGLTSRGRRTQKLEIHYVVGYARPSGSSGSKAFKLSTLQLKPGQSVTLNRRCPFRPVTTRRYYSGKHTISIQINGQVVGTKPFQLYVAGA